MSAAPARLPPTPALLSLRRMRRRPAEEAILRVLPMEGALLTTEIARRAEYPPTTVHKALRAMEKDAIVVCVERSTPPSGAALWRRA